MSLQLQQQIDELQQLLSEQCERADRYMAERDVLQKQLDDLQRERRRQGLEMSQL